VSTGREVGWVLGAAVEHDEQRRRLIGSRRNEELRRDRRGHQRGVRANQKKERTKTTKMKTTKKTMTGGGGNVR
jgi:hypothetical protein